MSFRVRPPALPGEVAERARLRAKWAEHARRRREVEDIARQEGGPQRMRAEAFLRREVEILARIDSSTNDGERAYLHEQAAALRQLADDEMKEARVKMSRDKARELRKAFRQKFSTLAAKYAASQDDR